jgi:hypothetical protein
MNEHEAKERRETDALKAEALRLGIHIPREPEWWWIDDEVARGVSSEMWKLTRVSNRVWQGRNKKAYSRRESQG